MTADFVASVHASVLSNMGLAEPAKPDAIIALDPSPAKPEAIIALDPSPQPDCSTCKGNKVYYLEEDDSLHPCPVCGGSP
jgi:hypothetical protein